MDVPEGLQRGPKRPKTAILGPHIPRRPFLTCEMVSLHCPGCALTCSTYILHCSISSQPPDPIMAPKWPFWTIWGPFGILFGPPSGSAAAPLTPETVPMHHLGCALTCSTYIPHCSASPEPQHPLMAPKLQFWAIWGPFGVLLGPP